MKAIPDLSITSQFLVHSLSISLLVLPPSLSLFLSLCLSVSLSLSLSLSLCPYPWSVSPPNRYIAIGPRARCTLLLAEGKSLVLGILIRVHWREEVFRVEKSSSEGAEPDIIYGNRFVPHSLCTYLYMYFQSIIQLLSLFSHLSPITPVSDTHTHAIIHTHL